MWRSRSHQLLAATLLVALATHAGAVFTNVVPVDSELFAICGNYVLHTPTFTCNSFVNGTGYFNCLNQPYNCICTAAAPPRFQKNFEPPCRYNYGVFPCEGITEARYYCGQHATACTKRCDVDAICPTVEACTCEAGYEFPSNPQYCSYEYQADSCLTQTAIGGNRETTECGVFAQSAYFLCPNNMTFESGLCRAVCNCMPGTGRTPGSNVKCDGMDRFCDIKDVELACGGGYVNCTKRCQYTNASPSQVGVCVVLPEKCVPRSAVQTTSTTRTCPFADSATLCGPAWGSCTQVISADGAVLNYTCVCNSNGFLQGNVPCQAWRSYVTADYALCQATCGPGFLNGTTYPCQQRRFWTIPPGIIPGSGTDIQKQAQWLVANNLMQFSTASMSYVDNIQNVRTYANNPNNAIMSAQAFMIECTCDTKAMLLADAMVRAATSNILRPNPSIESQLYTRGAGYYDPYGISFNYGSNPRTTQNPIFLDLSGVGPIIQLYPEYLPARLGNFYEVGSCRGPSVAVNSQIAYGTTQIRVNTVQPGSSDRSTTGQNPFTTLDVYPSTSAYYLLTEYSGNTAACVPLTPVSVYLVNCNTGCVPPACVCPTPTQTIRVIGQTATTWIVGLISPVNGLQNVLTCTGQDTFFNFARSGSQVPLLNASTYGNANYVNYHYSRADSLSALDGSFYCGSPIKGFIQNVYPSTWTQQDLYDEVSGLHALPEWAQRTVGQNVSVFTVIPSDAASKAAAQVNVISAAQYGPVSLSQVTTASCSCYPGWGGSACATNTLCCPCVFTTGPTAICTCGPRCVSDFEQFFAPITPYAVAASANAGFSSNVVYRFDTWFHSSPYLNGATCPYGSGNCDPSSYVRAAFSMCVHGIPQYDPNGGVYCQCLPGYDRYYLPSPGVNTYPGYYGIAGCNMAGIAPSGKSNCPLVESTANPKCPLVDQTQAWGPLPRACFCGGHGEIIASGECECDPGWRKNPNGCCTLTNSCPTCPENHARACNLTENYEPTWICSEATSDGVWVNNPDDNNCCSLFIEFSPCVNGAYANNEIVLNYTNGALVPLVFNNFSAPGVNPDGKICVCSAGPTPEGQMMQWTGKNCNMSSCPLFNGQPCGTFGKCVNGRCMQGSGLSAPFCQLNLNYYGCACQHDLTAQCRGGSLSNSICSGPSQGTCVTSTDPFLDLECQCTNGYTGNNCQISPCGVSNCNAASGAGTCERNATNLSSFYCQCKTTKLNCNTPTGCLFAGTNCEIDVTSSCGFINTEDANQATTCGESGVTHGYCNTANSSAPVCVCTDAWTGSKCEIEPCDPPCGDHGTCVQDPGGGAPECQCKLKWQDGVTPCSVNTCAPAIPDDSLPGAPCFCPDRRYSPASGCTQLECPIVNGVICGQPNCAIQSLSGCKSPSGNGCNFACGDNFPGFLGVCNNGTCTDCKGPTRYNFFTNTCENVCAQPNNTKSLTFGPFQPTVCTCTDGSLWQPSGCYEQTCVHGTWINTDKNNPYTGVCRCYPGWAEGPLGRCDVEYCSGHGTYDNFTAGSYGCSCFFPWTGPRCSGDICTNGFPEFSDQNDPDGVCVCPFAWQGRTCELSRCGSHGTPNLDGSACQCEPGWSGLFCTVFQCFPPNTNNGTYCFCNENFFGPVCQYYKCNVAGTFYNNSCHCGGVSKLVNDTMGFGNCTGNTCGPYGVADPLLLTCQCNARSTFLPQLPANISINCVPNCLNGGKFNNTPPYECSCPAGTFKPYCDTTPISSTGRSSTGRSSSTGGAPSGSSSSTGGSDTGSAPKTSPFNPILLLLLTLVVSTLSSLVYAR